eukprot:567746_1
MSVGLHTQFSSNRLLLKSQDGLQHKSHTMYFMNIGSKQKLKRSAIEDKLALSTFNRLHFFKCNLSKAYKTTFSYLMRNHRTINILEIYLIDDAILQGLKHQLIEFILSQSCSQLVKLAIRSNAQSTFALEDIFGALSTSKALCNTLQCVQFEHIEFNRSVKLDKTLSKFLFNASVTSHTLATLDIRNLRFSAKQNFDLAQALTTCLWDSRKRKKISQSCSINKLFFGGNDEWSQKGIHLMCDFIKYNCNLEHLGIDLVHGARDKPFISAIDPTTVGIFVLSMDDHPALQRLEIYHLQTYTLITLGAQFEKRSKAVRLTELYLQQVHQNTYANPMDHSVFPSILKMTKKIAWLQLLELKISVFCNLFEVKELCKLLPFCKHLNGLTFHCKMGEMFSKKQILICVEHIVETLKRMKQKNVSKGRMEIIDALEMNLVIANRGDSNIDQDIAVEILSYADISYAFDAGLLFFESTFLNKLDVMDRKEANEWLLNNWKRLPYGGKNMSDMRYKNARQKLVKLSGKIKNKNKKKKIKNELLS